MRPGVNGWVVVGTIATVIAAIPAAFEILERWQRPASPPPGLPTPTPVVGLPTPAATPPGEDSPTPPPESPDVATEGSERGGETPEPAASSLESLINHRAVPPGSAPSMAIALDGDSADVELLEAALVQGVSSAEMRLVAGFFKPAFRQRGFLRAVYSGDTEPLTSSGALAAVDRVLVGRVERACRPTGQFDSDLVTCDIRLNFKVINRHGAVADAGHVAMSGAGFSEDAARDRAVEMLVQQHGRRVISPK